MKYTDQQMEAMRSIRIHGLAGVPDNGRKQAISCPHGNRDRTPSCYIYPDNSFHCFSCGANGQNSIDFLISLMVDVEPKEAFKQALLELSKHI